MRRRGFLKLVLGAVASVVGGFYGWRPELGTGPKPLAGWTIRHKFNAGMAGAYIRDGAAMAHLYNAGDILTREPVEEFTIPTLWGPDGT